MINVIVVGFIILAAIVWVSMIVKEMPEDKLDESVEVEEEHSDNKE